MAGLKTRTPLKKAEAALLRPRGSLLPFPAEMMLK
jgi:hypothetical protein